MKIVVAMDSFKGSLSSLEVGKCIQENIMQVAPQAEVIVKGLADGGEGTVEVLSHALHLDMSEIEVYNAYGQPTCCHYAIDPEQKLAIIEAAEAIGLAKCTKRSPLLASSYGLGQVIKHCIDQGIRQFVIGLGGSATNDAGIGMMQALGMQVHFSQNRFHLLEMADFDFHLIPELASCHFIIASDVTNPLCGKQGATAVFGPQKGVLPEQMTVLDQVLDQYADAVSQALGCDHRNDPGAGAAGGLGFAFLSFMSSEMQSGIDIVMQANHLAEDIADADLVLTGEGCMDGQTIMGKAPAGVTQLARQHHVPVIGIAGSVRPEAENLHALGMTAFFSIQLQPLPLETALSAQMTQQQLGLTVRQVLRLWLSMQH